MPVKDFTFPLFRIQSQVKLLKKFGLVVLLFFSFIAASAQGRTEAPDISVKDLQGNSVTLSECKNKVVLLLIWSTSCPICRAEISNFNSLVQKFKGKDVVFLALTVEPNQKVARFLEKKRFDFLIVTGGFNEVAKYATVNSKGEFFLEYPSFFLIDKENKIALKTRGANKTELLAQRIESLLKENPEQKTVRH